LGVGVPIPAQPTEPTVTAAIIALFRQVHNEVRSEIAPLYIDDLNWVPADGANTIATIVRHLVGSEAETLRSVVGEACERDRDAEFVPSTTSKHELLGLLEAADSLLDDLTPALLDSELFAEIALPTLPADQTRPVATWLLGNYGHACQHVGHIQITKQLREQGAL
jgi:hypothetical protein